MKRMKKQPGPRKLRVAIVGGGKVGSVLGRVLAEEGVKITAVVSRSKSSATAAGRFIGCRNASTALTAIPAGTDIVLIATPHETVADVARTLAHLEGLDFKRLAVCHASGMLTASVLDPLAQRGAAVFSFHPLQTFPRDFAPQDIMPGARGIFYGVDGAPRGLRQARRLASALRGRVLLVPPEMREFYHAACVVASNHLTTMLAQVESMYRVLRPKDGNFYAAFGPIVEATIANVAARGPAAALSGPIARGGIDTVARHLEAVARFAPELMPYYTRMSLETVRLAVTKGSLTPARREALDVLIRSHTDETGKEHAE